MNWSQEIPKKDGWFWAIRKDPSGIPKTVPVEIRDNCTMIFSPNLLDPDNTGYVTWVRNDGPVFPIDSDIFLQWGDEILMGERPTIEVGVGNSIKCYRTALLTVKNKVVLDYGCGIGIGSNFIKPYCKDVFSYDISAEALRTGREHFPGLKFVDDYTALRPDIIVMCEVLEHIEKPEVEKLLAGFKSICPEIFITTPNGDFFKYHPTVEQRHGFHVWHYQHDELKELFQKYYEHVEVYGAAFDLGHDKFTIYAVHALNRDIP